MRTLLCAAAALIAFASAIPAQASEIYGGVIPPDVFTAPPAFAPPRVYNWTGVYIGINAGGSWSSSHWAEDPWSAAPLEGSYSLSGGFAGGTIGYNLQAGTTSFVVGVEADLAWSDVKGTTPAFIAQVVNFSPPFPSPGPPTITPTPGCAPNCEINSPWLATARLRFGYSFDWILPYVTAGFGIAKLQANMAGMPLGQQSSNNLGWTVGLGVEMVISGPWTAKLEFLHIDLNGFSCDKSCGALSAFDPSGNFIAGGVHINASENIIRAGLNFRIWNH